MRSPEFLAAILLWQSALLVNIGAPAAPEHLRYQREIIVPPPASGFVCAVLDAEVLAHTASAAHNDLRLYRSQGQSAAQAEVPYLLTESGPEPVADTQVRAEHVVQTGNELAFDLRMPDRVYSEIDLHLAATNFVATVHVTGAGSHGHSENLGTFGIFDLTSERLGRWTALPMAETSTPLLHMELALRRPDGQPMADIRPALVEGAGVPPSRERQTLYTPVASTERVTQMKTASSASLHVPAHVPVERVSFELAPGSPPDFYREVVVSARPDRPDLAESEIIDAGAIEEVHVPSGDPGLRTIDVRQLSVDATLGATLASNANVRVFVQNGAAAALPIGRVTLAMRERRVCFFAGSDARYTLRYGDAALAPPVYDTTALLAQTEPPTMAQLGPERRNPAWRSRQDTRPYTARHPELFWLLVLVCGGMMGGSALHLVQHRGGGGRG